LIIISKFIVDDPDGEEWVINGKFEFKSPRQVNEFSEMLAEAFKGLSKGYPFVYRKIVSMYGKEYE